MSDDCIKELEKMHDEISMLKSQLNAVDVSRELLKSDFEIIDTLLHDELCRYSCGAPRELWDLKYKVERITYGN